MKGLEEYIEVHKDRFLNELFELIRIPSISANESNKKDMVEAAGIDVSDRMLDVGCGYGAFLSVAQSFEVDCQGLEFDPRAADYCRSRRLPCELVQSENDLLCFLTSHDYDLIVMSHVLEHLRDPAAALSACARSRVLIEVPAYRRDLSEQFIDQEGHLNFFCNQSLLALLERMGLVVEAQGAFGPGMDLFWRRGWALSLKLLRCLSRDYFLRQYTVLRENGIWLRVLARGSACKS